jgi:hypothetical protein
VNQVSSAPVERPAEQSVVWPFVFWLSGILLAFSPTLASGFRLVQGGLGDSRLVNFTLEHSYRWLMGMPLAESLWSPPIFFPVQNVATYTDLMVGVAPFYWLWRWLGSDPHTAFQLWMLSCWTLNFASCYLVLRYGLRISAIASAVGAHLFAFGNPQYSSLAHQQLGPMFWPVLTLGGLVLMFREPERDWPARGWIAAAAVWGGLVMQLYTAVYALVFFVLGLGVATVVVVVRRRLREPFIKTVKNHLVAILVVSVVAVAVATPITARYRATAATTGMRKQHQVHLPKAIGWFLPGEGNRLYGQWQRRMAWNVYRGLGQTSGFGAVTLVACAAGLWFGRRRREVQLTVAAFSGLVFLTLTFPGGWSPWWVVREIVPGTAALRAVTRVGMMALFPAALGLAIVVGQTLEKRRWALAAALILVTVIEQPHQRPKFDKHIAVARIDAIASRVPANAESFVLVIKDPTWDKFIHDDAAWTALTAGVPTINGRYGHFPRAYPFRKPWIQTPEEEAALRADLQKWVTEAGMDPHKVPMIEVTPRPPRLGW